MPDQYTVRTIDELPVDAAPGSTASVLIVDGGEYKLARAVDLPTATGTGPDNVYDSFAAFEAWVAGGGTAAGGATAYVGAMAWICIPVGHVLYGTNPISRLPGWMPAGDVAFVAHFGALGSDKGTGNVPDTPATDEGAELQEAMTYGAVNGYDVCGARNRAYATSIPLTWGSTDNATEILRNSAPELRNVSIVAIGAGWTAGVISDPDPRNWTFGSAVVTVGKSHSGSNKSKVNTNNVEVFGNGLASVGIYYRGASESLFTGDRAIGCVDAQGRAGGSTDSDNCTDSHMSGCYFSETTYTADPSDPYNDWTLRTSCAFYQDSADMRLTGNTFGPSKYGLILGAFYNVVATENVLWLGDSAQTETGAWVLWISQGGNNYILNDNRIDDGRILVESFDGKFNDNRMIQWAGASPMMAVRANSATETMKNFMMTGNQFPQASVTVEMLTAGSGSWGTLACVYGDNVSTYSSGGTLVTLNGYDSIRGNFKTQAQGTKARSYDVEDTSGVTIGQMYRRNTDDAFAIVPMPSGTEEFRNQLTLSVPGKSRPGIGWAGFEQAFVMGHDSRAEFVAWNTNRISNGETLPNGTQKFVDGLCYVFSSGSSVISDLAGWEPEGDWTLRHFGALGDGATSDAAAVQEAISSAISNGVVNIFGHGEDNYVIDSTVVWGGTSTDRLHVDGRGCRVTAPSHDFPVFADTDGTASAVAAGSVKFSNIVATQTAVQTDINGATYYGGAQPEDYKIAALIHRGKGFGCVLEIVGVSANNFVNMVSDYGDWEGGETLSGDLICRNIKTNGCNFGIWTPGLTSLIVDGWENSETAFVQISGGTTLPPHVIYSTTRAIGAKNYSIRNVRDYSSNNGATIKLKGVTGGVISNIHGRSVPSIVELLSCVNVTGNGNALEDQTNDPALGETQGAILYVGCHNCHIEAYVEQDATDAHSFVSYPDTETGGLGVCVGCTVSLDVRKSNNSFVAWLDSDEGGTTVTVNSLYVTSAATSGVFTVQRNDVSFTPDGTTCIVGTISMETPGALLIGYVESGATNAVLRYDPTRSNATSYTISDNGTGTIFDRVACERSGTWTVTVRDSIGNVSPTTKLGDWHRVGDTVVVGFSFLGNIDTTGLTAGSEIRIGLPFPAKTAMDVQVMPISMANMGSVTGTPDYLLLRIEGGKDFGVIRGVRMLGADSAQLISNISSGVTDLQYFGGAYVVE